MGIAANGVVLQSSILNFGLDFSNASPIGGDDWPYAFYLPSEAATAWYHNALPNRPPELAPFVQQVAQFATGEYLDALAQGAEISPARKNDVVARIHDDTGLPEQYIRNNNLRVPYWRLESELLRGQGVEVGRLDSRFETPSIDRAENSPIWDPTDAAIDAPYTTAINEYLRQDLGYRTDMLYRTDVYNIIAKDGGWDDKHDGNPTTDVAPDLAAAMSYDPHLKVFSANGYFDFATPFSATVYTLNHLNILPSLMKNITYGFYQSGHMIYLAPPALEAYHADLERWYADTLAGR
jgi:carboxypeptidase C (cathepsin A)